MSIFQQITTGASREGVEGALEKKPEESKGNLITDLLAAPIRGVEGAVQGIYNLGDYAMGDALPDYDKKFLGTSDTMIGGFVEGTTQFLTGFVPVAGQLGKLGQVSRLAKAGAKSKKFKKMAQRRRIASDVGAGAIADFLVFDGQEARLSNLINNTPLANPVTDYLAATENDDEAFGRMKNVAEGLFIEAGMRSLLGGFLSGVRKMKQIREARVSEDPELAFQKIFDDLRNDPELNEGRTTAGLDKAFTTFVQKRFATTLNDDTVANPSSFDVMDQWVKSEDGQNSPYAPLFNKILESNPETLKNTEFGGFKQYDELKKTGGYNLQDRVITLAERNQRNKMLVGANLEKTFVHESMHAVTSIKLSETFGTQPKSSAPLEFAQYLRFIERTMTQLTDESPLKAIGNAYLDAVLNGQSRAVLSNPQKLMDSIKSRREAGRSTYGLKSIHEFTAEAMTNPKFFKDLYGAQPQNKGIVHKILKAVRDLLGIPQEYNSEFGNLVTSIRNVMNKQETDIINRMYDEGRIDADAIDEQDFVKALAEGDTDEYFGEGFQTIKAEDLQKLDDVGAELGKMDKMESLVRGIDEEAVRMDELPQKFEDDDITEIARGEDERTIPTRAPVKLDSVKGNIEGRQPRNLQVSERVDKVIKDLRAEKVKLYARTFASVRKLFAKVRDEYGLKIIDTKLDSKGGRVTPAVRRRVLLNYLRNNTVLDKETRGKILELVDSKMSDEFQRIDGAKYSLLKDPSYPMTNTDILTRADDKKLGESTAPQLTLSELATLADNPNYTLSMLRKGVEPELTPDRGFDTARTVQKKGKLKTGDVSVPENIQLQRPSSTLPTQRRAQFELDGLKKRVQKELDLNDGETDAFFGEGFQQANQRLIGMDGMGTDALNNMIKHASSTSGVIHIMRRLVSDMKLYSPEEKVDMTQLAQTSNALVDAFGGSKDTFEALAQQLRGNEGAMNQFRLEQSAIKMVMDRLAINVQKVAMDMKKNGMGNYTDNQRVDFLENLDRLYEVGRLWNMYGREAGLTLRQRGGLLQGKGSLAELHTKILNQNINNRDVGAKVATESGRQRYLRSKTITQSFEKIVDQVATATNTKHLVNNADVNPVIAAKIAKGVHGSKLMDMTLEYWTNSLLYGPTTQIVNLFGNGITLGLRAAELTVGSALTGNFEMTRAALGTAFHFDMWAESLKMAGKAFKEDSAQLTQGSKAYDDDYVNMPKITASNVNEVVPMHIADAGTFTSSIINGFGKYARFPGRMLGAGDELFKQLNYRYYVKTMLAYEGAVKGGLKGEALTKHVKDGFEGLLEEGRAYNQDNIDLNYYNNEIAPKLADGTYTPVEADSKYKEYVANRAKIDDTDRSRLAEKALEYAKENTFTSDLDENSVFGIVSKHLNQLKRNPVTRGLSFIVPFVRTPTNILAFAVDRTPLGRQHLAFYADGVKGISNLIAKTQFQYKSALNSADPVVKAQAYGKLATTTAAVGVGLHYAYSNSEYLTGGGPTDTDRRRALQMKGWQPYSIKVGDKYYSYQKADPMSTVLGMYVDMAEAIRYHDMDQEQAEWIMGVIGLSFINNIGNKSFLQGLDNIMGVMQDPVGSSSRLVGDIGAGFMPGYIQQVGNVQKFREIKEARTMLDAFLKRSPFRDSLMPKRNVLGEKIMIENPDFGLGVVTPVYMSSVNTDPVNQEIGRLNKGFSIPKSKLMNTFDMRQYENDEGQTAFDRYQELTGEVKVDGKTLREALTGLTKSSYYNNLDDGTDQELNLGVQPPRVKAMQKIINRYRKFAKSELLNEFPELREQMDELLRKRQLI